MTFRQSAVRNLLKFPGLLVAIVSTGILAAGFSGTCKAQEKAARGTFSKTDSARVEAAIDEILKRNGHGATAAVWLGGIDGAAWVERTAFEIMPSASAIKTFFLVELFAAHGTDLDAPLPGADAVLADDAHPAISHFTADQKQDIRRTLGGKSTRKIGEIMMGSAPASNVAYNAAANLVTACLGGPAELTRRIQARDPAFSTVYVRRYMLRDRKTDGDNETTAAALASLYRMLAARKLPGIEANTADAIRNAIVRKGKPADGFEYVKTGALDSDPLIRVEAGWKEAPGNPRPVVFVVMLRQPRPGDGQSRAEAGKVLAENCSAIQRILLKPAKK